MTLEILCQVVPGGDLPQQRGPFKEAALDQNIDMLSKENGSNIDQERASWFL